MQTMKAYTDITYPESNIVCRNWGQWKVDAKKCNNYKTD